MGCCCASPPSGEGDQEGHGDTLLPPPPPPEQKDARGAKGGAVRGVRDRDDDGDPGPPSSATKEVNFAVQGALGAMYSVRSSSKRKQRQLLPSPNLSEEDRALLSQTPGQLPLLRYGVYLEFTLEDVAVEPPGIDEDIVQDVEKELAAWAESMPEGTLSERSWTDEEVGVDFNDIFQRLLERRQEEIVRDKEQNNVRAAADKASTRRNSLTRSSDKVDLFFSNFADLAARVAETLIPEMQLSDDLKTVAASGMSDDGPYYDIGNLRFTIVTDHSHVYGGVENAQRSLYNELRATSAIVNLRVPIQHVHVPLSAAVRVGGHVVHVVAHHPIMREKHTLLYGSADGGVTIRSSSKTMESIARALGDAFNLKPHAIDAQKGEPRRVELFLAGDVQGHKSSSEGRYYVIPGRRFLPPVVAGSTEHPHGCFYLQFRPEFLTLYCKHRPLTPDAFTQWGDVGASTNDAEVRGAYHYLLACVVPATAAQLLRKALKTRRLRIKPPSQYNFDNDDEPLSDAVVDISRFCHRRGLSMRYLGFLRASINASTSVIRKRSKQASAGSKGKSPTMTAKKKNKKKKKNTTTPTAKETAPKSKKTSKSSSKLKKKTKAKATAAKKKTDEENDDNDEEEEDEDEDEDEDEEKEDEDRNQDANHGDEADKPQDRHAAQARAAAHVRHMLLQEMIIRCLKCRFRRHCRELIVDPDTHSTAYILVGISILRQSIFALDDAHDGRDSRNAVLLREIRWKYAVDVDVAELSDAIASFRNPTDSESWRDREEGTELLVRLLRELSLDWRVVGEKVTHTGLHKALRKMSLKAVVRKVLAHVPPAVNVARPRKVIGGVDDVGSLKAELEMRQLALGSEVDPALISTLTTLVRYDLDPEANVARLMDIIDRSHFEEDALSAASRDGNSVVVSIADKDDAISAAAAYYDRMGDLHKALQLTEASYSLCVQALGKNSVHAATCAMSLASLEERLGNAKRSLSLYKEAAKTLEAQLGENHPDFCACLNNVAGAYERAGKFGKAVALYSRVLTLTRKRFGGEHNEAYATCLANVGVAYNNAQRFDEAQPLLEEALQTFTDIVGAQDLATVRVLESLAQVYAKQGDFETAETMFEQALAERRAQESDTNPNVAMTLVSLAEMYLDCGRDAEAVSLYEEALSVREQRLGVDHADTRMCRYGYASVLMLLERFDSALAELEKIRNEDPAAAMQIALCHFYRQDFSKAAAVMEEALGKPDANGMSPAETADLLNNLAICYKQLGNAPKAERVYRRSLKARRAEFGDKSVEVAQTCWNLASLLDAEGRADDALPFYLECLEVREAELGEVEKTASVLDALALVFESLKQPAKAVKLATRACAIMEQELAQGHCDEEEVARYRNNAQFIQQSLEDQQKQ